MMLKSIGTSFLRARGITFYPQCDKTWPHDTLLPMASAEQTLNDAQYAFQSISAGETGDNDRNASRAKSLCKKIIRKYPTSTQAVEAHAILQRLGVEAYASKLAAEHRHKPHAEAHEAPRPAPREPNTLDDQTVLLDWSGLLSVILATPKTILGVVAFVALVLFGVFGVFVLGPLIVFVIMTGPFRHVMKPAQRREMNKFVIRANAWIDKRIESGSGLT